MLLTALTIMLPLVAIDQLQGYEPANKIIKEHLVDNSKEQIAIRSQLTEEEAEDIIDFLAKHGISAQKTMSSTDQVNRMTNQIWEISVTPTDTVEAIILLDEAGLPERKRSSIFAEFVNRIREGYTMPETYRILAKQLEEYVENQKGIVNAEVIIKWDKEAFQEEKVLKTLVYIRHIGTLDDPHSELATKLKKHILNNVDNLEEEHLIFVTEKETPMKYQLPDYSN